MTEQEKKDLKDAVIAELKSSGRNVAEATVVEKQDDVLYVVCYDTENNIARINPKALTESQKTWDTSLDLDDIIIDGVYNIKGNRLSASDNLPIGNVGKDASFAARLIVSVSPQGESVYRHIVGQTLILANAEGKETKIYARSGNRTSYDGGVSYTIEWGAWATQQTNINVGQVDSLDNLTDNGIYSGVWTKASYDSYPLTFVCIVINDYFLGVTPRRISQFVYGISKMDGSTVYQSRVWDDSKSAWGAWEILNKKEISSMISMEIAKVVADAPETFDTLKEIAEWIRTHGADAREMLASIQDLATDIETERNARTNAVSDIKKYALQYDTLGFSPTADKLSVFGKTLDGQGTLGGYIPAATTEKAGVMTAEDKKAVDGIAAAVEEGRKAALRELFIAAGALYNDSNKDASSKFQYDYYPHKAKHYFLNGIGDLTEEDMLQIYDERDAIYRLNKGRILQGNTGIRTIFTAKIAQPGDLYLDNGNDTALGVYTFSGCSNLERLHFSRIGSSEANNVSEWDIIMAAKKMQSTFNACTKLKRISPINARYTETFENTFRGCSALETVKILNLKANISFSDSPLINKSSLLLMINKSIANSAITITLHADAYATLAEDAEIVAALEAKPLVTLVSA